MNYVKIYASVLLLAGLAGVPASAKETTLNMIVIEGTDAKAMQAVVDAYQQQHPDVKINLQGFPFDQFFQVADLRLKSKDAGLDLIYVDAPVVASYASRGLLSPFPAGVDTSVLIQSAVSAGQYKGTQYALPINNSAEVLFFNPSLFKAAGIEPPAGIGPGDSMTQAEMDDLAAHRRWTWEQVADAARKMTIQKDGRTVQWGFTFEQYGRLYQMQPLGESLGSPIVANDGYTAEGYLNGDAWTKAATFWSNLYNDWKVSPRDLGWGEAAQLFGNGQLAMFVGGTWNIPILADSTTMYKIAPHPYFQGGKVVTPTGSWYIGVSAASEHQDIAFDFAKFLTTSSTGTKVWFDNLAQLPTYKPLLDQISSSDTYAPFPKNMFRLGVYESLNTAKTRPLTAAYDQLQDAFGTSFVDIANGVPVKEALDSAVQKFQSAAARVAQ